MFSFKILIALFALLAMVFAQITVPNTDALDEFVEDVLTQDVTDVPGVVFTVESLIDQLGK